MKKSITIVLLSTVALILSACGGSSSSEGSNTLPVDPMTESSLISIIYHVEEGYCSEELQNQLIAAAAGVTDYYLREESNDVTCATYNRTVSPTTCSTVDSGMGGPVSCVVGVTAI